MSKSQQSAARRRVPGPERREEIVSKAMQLFARKGLRGVRTREIAKACGISEALLYHFFGGKAEIYEAILEREIARVPAEAFFSEEAMESGDDARVFGEVARRMVREKRDDPTFMRLLLYSALEGHDLSRRFYAARIAGVLERLAAYIARRHEEGAFGPCDPVTAARAFLGQVVHLLMVRELFGVGPNGPEDWEKTVRSLVDLHLHGLRGARGEAARGRRRGRGGKGS